MAIEFPAAIEHDFTYRYDKDYYQWRFVNKKRNADYIGTPDHVTLNGPFKVKKQTRYTLEEDLLIGVYDIEIEIIFYFLQLRCIFIDRHDGDLVNGHIHL